RATRRSDDRPADRAPRRRRAGAGGDLPARSGREDRAASGHRPPDPRRARRRRTRQRRRRRASADRGRGRRLLAGRRGARDANRHRLDRARARGRGARAAVIYDTAVHEPLTDTPWDDARVREWIAAVVEDAERSLDHGVWPNHPRDDDEPPPLLEGMTTR